MIQSVKDKIKHSYIEAHIQNPVIDREKVKLLTTLLNYSTLSKKIKQQYILSVMLVQVALDTHEQIPISSEEPWDSYNEKLKTQLFVLAGDYYSGMYYELLACTENIDLIHLLASSIKEINECKMALYYQEYSTFEEFIEINSKIETLLIRRLAEFMDRSYLTPLIETWLTINKVSREKCYLFENKTSHWMKYWIDSKNRPIPAILSDLEIILNKNVKQAENLLAHIPLHFRVLKTNIEQSLKELSHKNASFAEEG